MLLNEVFCHHIYEYEKGLRSLILYTGNYSEQEGIENRLKKRAISYHIQKISKTKINVFFGNSDSVEIVKEIGKSNLSEYSPEEDFILGIMLGYDRGLQCKRFLEYRKRFESKKIAI